ncbi:MAG: dipeptidase [Colwellia sp.]|nr:dipeptidase [Colwellia sp.]
MKFTLLNKLRFNKPSFNKLALVALCSTFALTACQDKAVLTETTESPSAETIAKLANKIAQETLIADTHIDVPYRLEESYEDVSKATKEGEFDYPRAVKGGLNAAFMSIYIPSKLQKTGGSKALANKLIDDIEAIVKQSPNKFALAYSTKQVQDNFANGIISLPLGMENGSPIEGDLANLQHFYDRGIRYITLAHAKTNHISDSSYDKNRPAQGLTDFGKELIVEMNNIGVMVDISHVSDQAFYQVMAISKVPVIASHSSARFFTPGFERNMSDDMIKLLAKNGGVIHMTFSGIFISQKYREQSAAYDLVKADFIKANNLNEELAEDASKIDAFKDNYKIENPFDFGTLAMVLDHYDHVVNLVGIDHVGIGSDYDGVSGILPETLKDVATYPNLIAGLLERGYSEQDIKKLLSGNLMRVWQQVEAYAANH